MWECQVDTELRAKFVNLCKQQDVPAAQVIRTFMRLLNFRKQLLNAHIFKAYGKQ